MPPTGSAVCARRRDMLDGALKTVASLNEDIAR